VHLAFAFVIIGTKPHPNLLMKYPLHTQSKPVSGEAAKKLLEAIDAGGAVVNEQMIDLAKRLAARRRKAPKNG
jgi:hypothetical protein